MAISRAASVPAALVESLWQVAGAVLLGAATGWLGARALRAGEEHGAADPAPRRLFTVVLAFAVLGAAGLVHVDGILAVLVAGLAFNVAANRPDRAEDVPIDEAVNRFLVLPPFVGLGVVLPCAAWAELGWRGIALVAGVLLLRRLPVVWLLRRPLRLGRPDAVLLGWFGPIGVSALFYLTLGAERLGTEPVVLAAGNLVVAASTVVHGVTSSLGRMPYRRTCAAAVGDSTA